MTDTRKQQRVQIISEDGLGRTTQVCDADTGETIPRVYRIDLSFDIGQQRKYPYWRGQLYTHSPLVDVIAQVDVHSSCPYCKREMNESREKPLRDALDFHHDIERVQGTFANLSKLAVTSDFPLEHALAVIKQYEQAIRIFLGEDAHDDDEEEQG